MPTVDKLIVELIDDGRQATTEELATIITHVAKAPFATYLARIPIKLRHLVSNPDSSLSQKLSSLEIHLLKRVYEEQQWPVSTTTDRYIADLHKAIAHPKVQIWTYYYFAQPFVGFLAPSHVKGVAKPEAYLFVAYSPLYGTITTGYQTSAIEAVFTEGYIDVTRQQ